MFLGAGKVKQVKVPDGLNSIRDAHGERASLQILSSDLYIQIKK